jgi:hypothetical protein
MKARLFIDVQFDGRRTDAESIASAMDNVANTGMLALGDCWNEYGGAPKVGQFLVANTAQPGGSEHVCPDSPDHRHHPDPASVKAADGAGCNRGTDWIVDINCKHCGRSGSTRIDPNQIEF